MPCNVDIKELKALCREKKIRPTQHAMLRILQRNLTLSEVVHTIETGEIIEQYPEDYPAPSCLVLGRTPHPLHVVCSVYQGQVWIITAYVPSGQEWEKDYKTRKENRQ